MASDNDSVDNDIQIIVDSELDEQSADMQTLNNEIYDIHSVHDAKRLIEELLPNANFDGVVTTDKSHTDISNTIELPEYVSSIEQEEKLYKPIKNKKRMWLFYITIVITILALISSIFFIIKMGEYYRTIDTVTRLFKKVDELLDKKLYNQASYMLTQGTTFIHNAENWKKALKRFVLIAQHTNMYEPLLVPINMLDAKFLKNEELSVLIAYIYMKLAYYDEAVAVLSSVKNSRFISFKAEAALRAGINIDDSFTKVDNISVQIALGLRHTITDYIQAKEYSYQYLENAALLLAQQGDIEKAYELLLTDASYIQETPNYKLLAYFAFDIEKYSESLQYLQATSLNFTDYQYDLFRADIYFNQKRIMESIIIYENILREKPDYAAYIYTNLVWAYTLHNKAIEDIIMVLKQGERYFSNSQKILKLLVLLYLKINAPMRAEEIIEDYQMRLNTKIDSAFIDLLLFEIHFQNKSIMLQKQHVWELFNKYPSNITIIRLLLNILVRSYDVVSMKQILYHEHVQLYNNTVWYYYYVSFAQIFSTSTVDSDSTKTPFEITLYEYNTTTILPELYANYAYMLSKQKLYQKALSMIIEAEYVLQLYASSFIDVPHNEYTKRLSQILLLHSQILLEKGDVDSAQMLYQRAHYLLPDNYKTLLFQNKIADYTDS